MIRKKKKVTKTNLDTVRRVFAGIDQGNKFWKPKIGKNIIRILPSNREDGNFAYESIMHYGFKIEGRNRAFPCLSVFKKACPACQVISAHDTDSDPDVKDILKNLGRRYQYLMNIIDRADPQGRVLIWSAPKGVMSEIYHFVSDDDYGDITDVSGGRDVKIDRRGEGLQTKYSVRVSPKISKINVEGWEDGRFNLEKEAYMEIPSTKKYISYLEDNFGSVLQVYAALGLEEKDDDEEEDEEEEEKPVRRIKKKKPAKVIRRNKEEEDEDEEDEGTDDIEDL